ncbi:MAG: SMP-30/gluconolactonase/LRE family protein [Bacteroidetes bacterium]|nr:SMP-30/gluconolactonase/LRE family protein [Bacteroidota bacterium]
MNSTKWKVEKLVEHSCLLGEGPVWDEKTKTICWVDILNGMIHDYSPINGKMKSLELHEMIGSLAICTDGHFMAALQNGFAFIDRATGNIKRIADPESHLPENRFNEGKCDPAGRFWAGTMALSEEDGKGNMYLLHEDLAISQKMSGVSISNGLAWSIDDRTMYYIDSPSFEVVAFDYEKSSGQISNKRTVIKIGKEEGSPDGMTIDNEGMLWVAHWGGWQVARWDPNTGKKLLSIPVPVERVTSCTFGGDHFEDLFISTAKVGLDEKGLAKQPMAGFLFVVRNCGFKGMPAVEFKV